MCDSRADNECSQPAGVGLSSFNGSTIGGVDNLKEASEDFDKFLSIFFTDIFPQFSHLPFHITGESFAGTYVPGFVDYIGRRQQLGIPGVFQKTIDSIVLVDAVIDILGSGPIGAYDHMCRFDKDGNNKAKTGFDETACRAIEKAVPECDRLNSYCLETYDLKLCHAAFTFCSTQIEVFDGEDRNVYDDRYWCNGTQPLCDRDGHYVEYLNLPEVQGALGLKEWNYSSINYDLNERWAQSGDMFRPTTREMTWILDESPTKVLVINGNNDIVV
jgi:cathepsin A (carboxypeptidase C)